MYTAHLVESYGGSLISSGLYGEVWKLNDTAFKFPLKYGRIEYSELKISKIMSEANLSPKYYGGKNGLKGYIRMELLPHLTLKHSEKRNNPFIHTEILLSIAKMHRLGIVHNDIHDKNILIGVDNSITLIDFGLATLFDDYVSNRNYDGWKRDIAAELGDLYENGTGVFGSIGTPIEFIRAMNRVFPELTDTENNPDCRIDWELITPEKVDRLWTTFSSYLNVCRLVPLAS